MKLLTTPDIGMPGKRGVFEVEFDFNDVDTASQDLGITIPANSLVTISASRMTAFDSGTSDVLNLGYTGSLAAFISALDLHSSAGLGAKTEFHVTTERELLYGITTVGAVATHGRVKVFIEIVRLS